MFEACLISAVVTFVIAVFGWVTIYSLLNTFVENVCLNKRQSFIALIFAIIISAFVFQYSFNTILDVNIEKEKILEVTIVTISGVVKRISFEGDMVEILLDTHEKSFVRNIRYGTFRYLNLTKEGDCVEIDCIMDQSGHNDWTIHIRDFRNLTLSTEHEDPYEGFIQNE